MSKQSTNIARICASLILGFTQVSFAQETDPALMTIPPPPVLRGPGADASTAGAANGAGPTVGTSKTNPALPSMGSPAPSATMPRPSNTGSTSLFNNKNDAASTQSATASAVNTETAAMLAAQRAAAAAMVPSTTTWVFQQFPAANTMYSMPQRK